MDCWIAGFVGGEECGDVVVLGVLAGRARGRWGIGGLVGCAGLS